MARTAFRRHLRTLIPVELTLLMALVIPAALAETATVTLSVSAPVVDLGDGVRLTGSVSGDPGCTGARPVILQWQPADSAGFDVVGDGTTEADGAFAFDHTQQHSGRYRAIFPEDGTCLAATSNEALVQVRERVDAALVTGSSAAGSCVQVAASVQPQRPGQTVELQKQAGSGWTVLERLTLDPRSAAFASPCFTFDDVGVVRLRVRWIAQDTLNETASSPVLGFEVSTAGWMDAIERAIGDRAVSVAVGQDHVLLFHHAAQTPRRPASNEKLLLAMTMYETLGVGFRIRTSVAAEPGQTSGKVRNLWILGRGDPTVDGGTMAALAHNLVDAGITRVNGRVLGSTNFFHRDWDAPGWDNDARDYVNRPTALAFEGNHDAVPERAAAKALTRRLEALGVHVDGRPTSGDAPADLETVAFARSQTLQHLFIKMLRASDNFFAETLGKRLGAETRGLPGTIAKGAGAIQSWTDAHGGDFRLNDSSGLSYANRVTAQGIVRLLWFAEGQPWGSDLRAALPTGGQGTLVHRLRGISVRAKTGTLDGVSALSGWVKTGPGSWTEFSILSQGLSKTVASDIEDRIVEILDNRLG